jgi:hypothetical protein
LGLYSISDFGFRIAERIIDFGLQFAERKCRNPQSEIRNGDLFTQSSQSLHRSFTQHDKLFFILIGEFKNNFSPNTKKWRYVMKFFKLVSTLIAVGIFFLFLALQDANAQFFDDFSSPTLDPAWTVVQTWPGGVPRAHGFTQPGNHYSLTDNPGYLRYGLDPMTHWDGFLNGYTTISGYHSCCTHDAGLEIHRAFSGDNWRFEVGGIFHLPFTNGRAFAVRLYFGTGAVPTYWVHLHRIADVHANEVRLQLSEKTGPALGDQNSLEILDPNGAWYYGTNNYPTPAPLFFRVERAGGVLTAYWSDDGVAWNTAWSHDLGSALDGLDQRVVISGLSWFNTGGSYADYDYISVTPTVITVDIDLKPGSDPNSINPKNKGVIPVAILTTATFDATTVDPLSVAFGPNGATESHGKGHIEDADGDGDMDLVLHFKTQDTGIQCGDTEASLTGQTFGGQTITGTDAIQTVGCGTGKAMAEAEAGIPAGYALLQNYPNPFNPETEMRFQLPEAGYVVVKIFNINGEEIRTLVDAPYQAGYHRVRWDGKDKNGNAVASGVYLYQLQAGGFSQVRKMSLLR